MHPITLRLRLVKAKTSAATSTSAVSAMTVREYKARSGQGRLKYRLYRHPLVMFVVGPAYLSATLLTPTGHLGSPKSA
jgi:hypothetical protein